MPKSQYTRENKYTVFLLDTGLVATQFAGKKWTKDERKSVLDVNDPNDIRMLYIVTKNLKSENLTGFVEELNEQCEDLELVFSVREHPRRKKLQIIWRERTIEEKIEGLLDDLV